MNGAAADGVENWTRGREEGPLRMKLSEYENDELRGQILGEGSDKHTYFYCQQFAATDFRLYRQVWQISNLVAVHDYGRSTMDAGR